MPDLLLNIYWEDIMASLRMAGPLMDYPVIINAAQAIRDGRKMISLQMCSRSDALKARGFLMAGTLLMMFWCNACLRTKKTSRMHVKEPPVTGARETEASGLTVTTTPSPPLLDATTMEQETIITILPTMTTDQVATMLRDPTTQL
jgi:hypothetical protein